MRWVSAAVVTAVVFGLLDAIWLGRIGRPIYTDRLGELLAPRVDMTAALLFYAIYVLGITYLVTVPALERDSPLSAAVGGAVLGLVAYATWNLTNLAVLRGFPASIVPIDMAWGAVATAVTALVTVLVVRALPWVSS
ncbi:DUF2177 family protein [Nostocoides sp. F2B08]|uniref:DUF2177 family protein n=1 Tax=Nostocoides sp. F2B08 TaxID=2653936 RepID=UPI00126347C3|nr:DUF2177 family protein [Tetrasphaera sp. F2B08]KAB7743004.1 DUF2177 family protein [Tetrasphaera sp. F2B08]